MEALTLPITADADKTALPTTGKTGMLSIVGVVTTETVAVQIPTVWPSSSADLANDAHWTPLTQDDAAVVLRAGHNARRIPGDLFIRLVKSAGVAGNAYGVRYA